MRRFERLLAILGIAVMLFGGFEALAQQVTNLSCTNYIKGTCTKLECEQVNTSQCAIGGIPGPDYDHVIQAANTYGACTSQTGGTCDPNGQAASCTVTKYIAFCDADHECCTDKTMVQGC